MRHPDPKRIAAEQKRDRACMRLEVLCNGIGQTLQNGERYYPESIRLIIEQVNGELLEAVDAMEAANKAYEPYWRRRRVRMRRVPTPKKTPKAA